jgi:hypothetical protein
MHPKLKELEEAARNSVKFSDRNRFHDLANPDTVLKLVEVIAKFQDKIEEAHKLVNAMAGQEYWDRAEQWLAENKNYRQELNDTLSRINE